MHTQPSNQQSPKGIASFCKIFYSFWVILPVLFFYALVCAVATLIENDYGSIAAHTIVYGSWWFTLLHVYLICALIASFVRSCAMRRKKYASLLLHFSFIVIIVGAGITRYFGTEGMMSIEEGQSSNFYYSSDNFVNITAFDGQQKQYANIPANISVFGTLFSRPTLKDEAILFDKPIAIRSSDIAILQDRDTKNKSNRMILHLEVSYNGETKSIAIIGGNGTTNEHMPVREEIGGMKMSFHWGSKRVELPFAIRLLEFEKKTYAGTDNPSSYASEVEVLDSSGAIIMPFRIFMNHVLDFEGYRFYQSSYFFNEESNSYSSILSVNKDPGKLPTYIGYILLMLGAIWLLFDNNGRFKKLSRFLAQQQMAQKAVFIIGACIMFSYTTQLYAFPTNTQTQPQDTNTEMPKNIAYALWLALNDSQKSPSAINPETIQERLMMLRENSKDFSERFARIQIQDYYGRIQPFDTMAMHIMHKIHKKDGFNGLSNVQVLLGLMAFPNDWATIRFIDTSTPKLREILGVPKEQRYVSKMDIYDPLADDSKIYNYFVDTMQKPESEYNTFDKDVRALTERYEILKSVQSFAYFRIFPDIKTQRWYSIAEVMNLRFTNQITQEQYEEIMRPIDAMMSLLLYGIMEGVTTNSWSKAIAALKEIENYQAQNGGQNYLSQSRIDWEIRLNHYNIFETLILPYILLGLTGFVLVLIFIYKDKPIPKRIYQMFFTLVALCVLAHTFGLGVRWYVADHSPWSNAYESMLYIAWAAGIAGVVFFSRFVLALCATSFLAGISLFVAHLGYMDPQIQNLVPVLQSYWLNIHVSIITAGYGFLGLCFVLGVFSLVLFILRTQNKPNIDKAIFSVGAINEMSMILGLFMLTIGNFLGAVWANESWGRYWGWDAKETWALITIGIYAIVLHLRFLGFRYMPFVFATGSVLAFYSVLMTYFGVNHYLSGKHSYAAGDPVPIPIGLYIFVACTIALIIAARAKSKLIAPPLEPDSSESITISNVQDSQKIQLIQTNNIDSGATLSPKT